MSLALRKKISLLTFSLTLLTVTGCGGSAGIKNESSASVTTNSDPVWYSKPINVLGLSLGGLKKHIVVEKNNNFHKAFSDTVRSLGYKTIKNYKDDNYKVKYASFRSDCTRLILVGFVEPLNGEKPYVYTSNKSDRVYCGGTYGSIAEGDRENSLVKSFIEKSADNLEKNGMPFNFKSTNGNNFGMEKVNGKHKIYLKGFGGSKIFDMKKPPELN